MSATHKRVRTKTLHLKARQCSRIRARSRSEGYPGSFRNMHKRLQKSYKSRTFTVCHVNHFYSKWRLQEVSPVSKHRGINRLHWIRYLNEQMYSNCKKKKKEMNWRNSHLSCSKHKLMYCLQHQVFKELEHQLNWLSLVILEIMGI